MPGIPYVTKTPLNYYVTVLVVSGLFIFFMILAFIGRLDTWGAVICFLFFSAIIYANFGRYLAKIKMDKHRIEIHYYFPWNKPEVFSFERIIEVDHKEMPWLSRFDRWYSGYQWLFLKNEKGEVCKLYYNINSSDDEKLLNQVRSNLNL
jgi:hypothetical protein